MYVDVILNSMYTLLFVEVWHTNEDNLNAIDRATVVDLCRVFTLFVVEYLKL